MSQTAGIDKRRLHSQGSIKREKREDKRLADMFLSLSFFFLIYSRCYNFFFFGGGGHSITALRPPEARIKVGENNLKHGYTSQMHP